MIDTISAFAVDLAGDRGLKQIAEIGVGILIAAAAMASLPFMAARNPEIERDDNWPAANPDD